MWRLTAVLFLLSAGTGTLIGDPTESRALGSFFGTNEKERFIGSVKTNIGHLEAAAGVAALIKVLLMMKHGKVVPSLWYSKENENPQLKLHQYAFVVPTECHQWKMNGDQARIACVNSFGFGGTNAHAIVTQYQRKKEVTKDSSEAAMIIPPVITLSAFDEESLRITAKTFRDNVEQGNYNMGQVAYTSTCKRDHRPKRKAFPVQSKTDLVNQCQRFISEGQKSEQFIENKKIVFVFCGVGTTWSGMAKSLLKHKTFEQQIKAIDQYLQPLAGWKIEDKLRADDDSVMSDPLVSHIAIFAYQVALAALWQHFGVKPDAIVGQSVGEVAAAHASGFIDLEGAVRIIYYRSKALAAVNTGTMAVIKNCEVNEVEKHCKQTKSLSIAVYSSPVACVVSGDEQELRELENTYITQCNGRSQMIYLGVKCAYHSRFVDTAAKEMTGKIGNVKTYPPTTTLFSTVTGEVMTNGLMGKADYWEQNVRYPVLFSTAIQRSHEKSKHTIYMEIGPSPVLVAHIKAILPKTGDISVVPSSKRNAECETMANALCTLYESGYDLKWENIYQCHEIQTDVPVYTGKKYKQLYQSQSVLQAVQSGGSVVSNSGHPYVKVASNTELDTEMEALIDDKRTPYVYEHVIGGETLLPGAFNAEIGYEIAKSIGFQTESVSLSLEFQRPVKLVNRQPKVLAVSTEKRDTGMLFHVFHDNTVSCKGTVRPVNMRNNERDALLNIKCIEAGLRMTEHTELDKVKVYDIFNSSGFSYGKNFRMITHLLHNENESLSNIEVPEKIMKDTGSMTIHPCILDILLQTTIMTAKGLTLLKDETVRFLPVAIEDIRCLRNPEKHMIIHSKLTDVKVLETAFQMHFNMVLTNTNGDRVLEILNFMTYSKRFGAHAPADLNYELNWHSVHMHSKDKRIPNVLVLTRNMPLEDRDLFPNYPLVSLSTNIKGNARTHVSDTFTNHHGLLDAVIYFAKGLPIDGNVLSTQGVSDIYSTVDEECQLLIELLRYIRNENVNKPVYIVTENAQVAEQSNKAINCVGSALWGFVRSGNIEFIADMTLVDLQPSLEKCKDTLIEFIGMTCGKTPFTGTEITIRNNQLMKAEFSKIGKYTKISSSTNQFQCISGEHRLMCDVAETNDGVYLSPVKKPQETKHRSNSSSLHVNSVTKATELALPQTTLSRYIDYPMESFDSGNPVFALEYQGIIEDERTLPSRIKCHMKIDTSDKLFSGRWESVALFPCCVRTKIHVPKKCMVSTKDIPFYQSGLLTYSMILLKMAAYIPPRATVYFYHNSKDDMLFTLVKMMFRTKKQSLVKLVHEATGVNESDVFVTLESVEKSMKTIQGFKHIVCLQEHIGKEALAAFKMSAQKQVSVIALSDIFTETEIQKELPKIVKWLKENSKIFQAVENRNNNKRDESSHFPCQSIKVRTDTSQCLIPVKKQLTNLFNQSDTYLMTGGLSGLGWELTRSMAEMGAGTIATMTRRSPSTEVQQKIRDLEIQTGCKIVCLQGDVSDIDSVRKGLTSLQQRSTHGKVAGIFHCAGVTQSRLIIDMTNEDLTAVLKPKVLGTLNLHVVSSEMSLPLDYFVVASSISSLIGSAGQTNYGAANSFMDALMTWRRQRGLPGQSINWGALEVGMAADTELADMFIKRGFNLMTVNEIRSCFQTCLLQNSSRVVFADMNWDIVGSFFSNENMKRVKMQFINVIKESASMLTSTNSEGDQYEFNTTALKQKGADERVDALLTVVKVLASKAIGCEIDNSNVGLPMAELPFDSMSRETLINILHQKTGYRIAREFMMNTSNSLTDVMQHIYKNLFSEDSPVINMAAQKRENPHKQQNGTVKWQQGEVLSHQF